MSYAMIEITKEKQSELMEHAEKAYKHIGKMLECVEQLGESESQMGQRDDEWYIRKMNRERMGYRDDMGERFGERRGVRGTGPYSRYGNRDPYFD